MRNFDLRGSLTAYALSRRMLRRLPLLLLAIAALLVVEPLIHSHPLNGGGKDAGSVTAPSVCAICAVAAQHITVARAFIPAPAIVVEHLIAFAPVAHSADLPLPRASRAPPAA